MASSSSPRTSRITPSPTHIFDYDYNTNTITDITPSAANGDPADLANQLAETPSFTDRFLMLPNGQALFTVGEDDHLYVYTGTGAVDSSSTPSISGIASNGSNSYTLTGSALNGASQGATYGDDAQMDTNYPIVSVATEIGTTYYATTTDWNMTGVGVANGATSVNFALPSTISSPPNISADSLDAADGQPLTQRDGRDLHRSQWRVHRRLRRHDQLGRRHPDDRHHHRPEWLGRLHGHGHPHLLSAKDPRPSR